jgi:hypothetical protein
MLAHGGLATADLLSALAMLGATWGFWRVLHDDSRFALSRSCLLMAAAVLMKFSGLLMIPIAVVLVAARVLFGGGAAQALSIRRLGVITLAHVAVGFVLIWASFGFRFSPNPPETDFDSYRVEWAELEGASEIVDSTVSWLRNTELLPEAFVYGLAHTLRNAGDRPSFFRGDVSTEASVWFFPYAFVAKSTVPLLVLFAVAVGLICVDVFRRRTNRVYQLLPFVVLVVVVFFGALASGLNIGHRHLIAMYPPVFILVGVGIAGQIDLRRWGTQRGAVIQLALVSALTWQAVAAFRAHPHYLAYFNELAGGPTNGYRNLVDSSLDWGQDLPFLADWLEQHSVNDEPFHLAYFGVDRPHRYFPSAELLPSRTPLMVSRFRPGLYAVSATVLQSVYLPTPGEWRAEYEQHLTGLTRNVELYEAARAQPFQLQQLTAAVPQGFWPSTYLEFNLLRLSKLTAHLRTREPVANVAGSILIYRLTDTDIDSLELKAP